MLQACHFLYKEYQMCCINELYPSRNKQGVSHPTTDFGLPGKRNQQDVLHSNRIPLTQHVTDQWLYDDNVNIATLQNWFL